MIMEKAYSNILSSNMNFDKHMNKLNDIYKKGKDEIEKKGGVSTFSKDEKDIIKNVRINNLIGIVDKLESSLFFSLEKEHSIKNDNNKLVEKLSDIRLRKPVYGKEKPELLNLKNKTGYQKFQLVSKQYRMRSQYNKIRGENLKLANRIEKQ